jgi:hypothetical protein
MMDFLLGDVRKNRFPGRLADRKSTVAALPAESVMALAFYDSGRAGFEILDQLGEGDLSGESAKNMDMIFHTADLKRVALQAPQGSGQIGMHLRSEFGGLQEWHSIFGGENDVHQNKGERLRHIQLQHLYMLLSRTILRPFSFRARRRGWMFPGVETP